MSQSGGASPHGGRITLTARNVGDGWNRIGEQAQFYAKTVAGTRDVFVHYKVELLRMIAQMSLGLGALALIGGTIVVVAFLLSQAGSLVALQGYSALSNVGVEALTGFATVYINVRLAPPVIIAAALAATIGASTTAQLGAMRINEEIDALESISVRTVPYLCSTRLLAGLFLSIPLYCVAMLAAMGGSRLVVTAFYGQSDGVYDHYFNTFLNPVDVFLSFLQGITMVFAVMLVHTYYGYHASGGPAGVGEAVGRAVRASLVTSLFVSFFVGIAIFGATGGLDISG
ncbi:MAG: ABC transporter permease [Mycobacterium sp.]